MAWDEMYGRNLHGWMKNLWDFTREYNERGNSVPLPSYVYIAFTNPKMIRWSRHIDKQPDLAVHVIGRCVEALVVNKLAADINSRNVQVSNDELACLSTILGIKSDGVMLLLSHPGAIELTNMVFFALVDFYSESTYPREFLDVLLDVVQKTFGILSQALPAELNATMRDQTDALMAVSDGQCQLLI